MNKDRQDLLISATKKWLIDVVVGLNLCPFARKPLEAGKIKIRVSNFDRLDEQIHAALDELNNGSSETELIILDESIDFRGFYGLCSELEEMLAEAGIGDNFQVVAFHPEFRFEGMGSGEAANLVNRSPYPTIHILTSASMNELNLSPDQGEEISLKNEKLLKSLSRERIRELFPWTSKP